MARPRNEELYVGGEKAGEAISQQDLGEHKAIEPVTGEQAAKTAIEKGSVHERAGADHRHGDRRRRLAPRSLPPCVNGVNQPIVRGQETVVKRKFVGSAGPVSHHQVPAAAQPD